MIALMALAMVGCPQDTNKNDDDDAEEVTPGTFTADLSADLYAGTAAKSDIGGTYNTWGGFSVLLMKDDQEIDGTNPQALGTLENPVYQLKKGGNMAFAKYPTAEGNSKVKTDSNVYDSCAAIVTADDFTFIVDPAKITLDQVYVMANSSEIAGDAWIAAGRNIDLKGYKPYIIALFDATEDVGTFAYEGHCDWGAEVYKMAVAGSGVTFPTTWDEFLPEPKIELTLAFTKQVGAKFIIKGSSSGQSDVEIPFSNGVATTTFAIEDLTAWGKDYYAFWFKLAAGDDTTLVALDKQFGAGATTLGTAIKITDANTNNYEATDLKTAGTYKITVDFTGDEPTIKVEAVSGGSTPTTYNITVDSEITGGTVTVNPTSAAKDATITVTATPTDAENDEVKTLTYKVGDGEAQTINAVEGVYSFTMPAGNVTVSATFGPKA